MTHFKLDSSRLNCLKVSQDLSLVSGGFEDSFINIWSLKGEPLRALQTTTSTQQSFLPEESFSPTSPSSLSLASRSHGSINPITNSSPPFPTLNMMTDTSDLKERQDSLLRESHGSLCKKLIGHSGPVYSTSFSPDHRYLVSCSEDKTGTFIWPKCAFLPFNFFILFYF